MLVVSAAIIAGVYGALTSRQVDPISGHFGVPPGSGLMSGRTTPRTEKLERADTPHPSVRGSIIDDMGEPIQGLKVELIPADKTGDAQWNDTKYSWSNNSGEYQFKDAPSGEYFVGIHINDAPEGKHPFATSYYPGVGTERDAERVYVGESGDVFLKWMRLRRIDTVTLDLKILWNDGQPVERGNLLFYNSSYPHQGVIGDVAPQFDVGRAQFTLPVGFEYYARAKVDCDAGATIKTVESRPIQQLQIDRNFRATELTFIIPAPKCPLWVPPHN